jgi:hypothetical protein
MNKTEHEKLRQLIHDIRSPFSVICMGLDALRALREDEEQFLAICDTIEQEGIARMREKLDELPESIARLLQTGP